MIRLRTICLVVTNACAPDPRVERHAKWLAEEGFDVCVFAWDRNHDQPEETDKNGFRILRKRIGKSPPRSSIQVYFQKKTFLRSINGDFDYILYNDSDSITTPQLHANFQLLDLHDIAHAWPVMQKHSIMRRILRRRMMKNLRKNSRRFVHFFTSSDGLKKYFYENFQINSTPIYNKRDPYELPRPMNKTIGYFGRIRDMSAIHLLQTAAGKNGFNVIIAGDGPCVNQMLSNYPEIDYRGRFTEFELTKLMEEIDIMFAMYDPKKENIREGAIPVKMFDAAAYGRPTITTDNTPMGQYCLEHKKGAVANFYSIESVINAMNDAYTMDKIKIQGTELERDKFLDVFRNL